MVCRYAPAMPTIGRVGSLSVMIFRNDHDSPHFHVFGDRFSAKFAIADAALLSINGTMPASARRAGVAWGQRHRAELYDNWELARAGPPARKIES